ncbi:MAG: hypothetical protein ABI579_07400 [Candidatus Sumerlaeota bacterium]
MHFEDRSFLLKVLPLAAIPFIIFLSITLHWALISTPDNQFFGMLQGDQPSYTAFARGTYLRGNGLVYSTPFDSDPAAPRVLVNITYTALGVLVRMLGDHPAVAWEIWRGFFGVSVLCLYALMITQILKGRARWFAVAFGFFCGGAGWLYAFQVHRHFPEYDFLTCIERAEANYGWWALNLFRQGLYPLELFYHCLMLGTLYLYLRRRVALAVAIAATTWWCHTITGALLTTILGLMLLIDCVRDRQNWKRHFIAAMVLGIFSLAALYYNLVFIQGFPSIRSWTDSTFQQNGFMYLADYPRAYGMLIIVPLLCLWRPLRQYIRNTREGTLLIVWIVSVVCWCHHEAIFVTYLAPIHFSRGHLYGALVLLAAKSLELFLENHKMNRALLSALVFFFAIALIDNLLFVVRLAFREPEFGILTFNADAMNVLDFYRHRKDEVTIHCQDRGIGVLLLATTSNRVYCCEPILTPFHQEKIATFGILNAAGNAEGMKKQGLDELILFRDGMGHDNDWVKDPAKLTILMENSSFIVGRLPN